VVKVRYASNMGSKGAPLRAHVAYLSREQRETRRAKGEGQVKSPELSRQVDYLQRGEAPPSDRFAFYHRSEEGVDARALTAGWAEDHRHFRMIVSAEDGEALGDLRPFIREVMAGLEVKLGTKLTWLAIDHWDTDNPHTHVLIRGVTADGQDLFIPSRLISSGIREHAQAIVTRVLGPRLDRDLVNARQSEIGRQAVTELDRELRHEAVDGWVRPTRPEHFARLQRLEDWDLARREGVGWQLAENLAVRFKVLAEREDVERIAARYLQPGEAIPLLEAESRAPTIGELVHLSPADDFGDRFLAIIETGKGELRYARFEKADDLAILADAQPGAIVILQPNDPEIRPSDETVARIARQIGGLYSAELHERAEPHVGRGLIEANIRRLEAMRRMGLVVRRSDGRFEIGADHLDRALAFEERLHRRAPVSAKVVSYWSLEEQIHAHGPTSLDRVLSGEAGPIKGEGLFVRRHADALQQRRLFLIEQGWMGQADQQLSRTAIQQLSDLEIRQAARSLSEELGKPVVTYRANSVSGVYARRIDLAQGRMALIESHASAHLVPWRPVLERFAGRQVQGLARGQGYSWKLERGLGIGLPPM
jgi:hypothetical protein